MISRPGQTHEQLVFADSQWERLGRIAHADRSIPWMYDFTGASCAVPGDEPLVELIITGRDKDNRSIMGRAWLDLDHPDRPLEIEAEPVLTPGARGAFDENGVSYPTIERTADGVDHLYFAGWMPTVLTPFQNHVGLARRAPGGSFERVSRAPVLDRTDDDPFGTASSCVVRDGDEWRLWYTSFTSWGDADDPAAHTYLIKSARSTDGVDWHRDGHVAIGWEHPGEHSTCRPTVLRLADGYHMWFCWRGDRYQIGYARSTDGWHWQRDDTAAGITSQDGDWELGEQGYPSVFVRGDHAYLLYCGHGYGQEGLGLARRRLTSGT